VASKWGLRPEPFYLGVGFIVFGLTISVFLVRETRCHADFEARTHRRPDEIISEKRKKTPI